MSVSHHDSEHVRFRQSESKTICDKTMDNSLCTRFNLRIVLSDLNIYMSLNVECHLTHLKVCFHFIFSKYCFVNSFEKPPHVCVSVCDVCQKHQMLCFTLFISLTVWRVPVSPASLNDLLSSGPQWWLCFSLPHCCSQVSLLLTCVCSLSQFTAI